jgi:hypothetical protein
VFQVKVSTAVRASAIAGVLAGGSLAVADQYEGDCGPGEYDRASCLDAFLDGIARCLDKDFYPSQDDKEDCITTEMTAYINCLEGTCDETWEEDNGEKPTNKQCQKRKEDQIEWCRDNLSGREEEECEDAAEREYEECGDRSKPSACDATISAVTVSGVVSDGSVVAGGTTEGYIDVVPDVSGCVVDSVETKAYVETSASGGQWVALGAYGVNADGRLVATFDARDLPLSTRYRRVTLEVLWYAGDEFIDSETFQITLEDSEVAGDFDRDGAVDQIDMAAYLDSFAAGATRADIDDSGDVTASDLVDFVDLTISN